MYRYVPVREEDAFAEIEEDGSSGDSGSEDERIGTRGWVQQQERRRGRYRIATTSALYNVQAGL